MDPCPRCASVRVETDSYWVGKSGQHIGTQEGGSWASVPLECLGPKKEVLRFDEVVMGS